MIQNFHIAQIALFASEICLASALSSLLTLKTKIWFIPIWIHLIKPQNRTNFSTFPRSMHFHIFWASEKIVKNVTTSHKFHNFQIIPDDVGISFILLIFHDLQHKIIWSIRNSSFDDILSEKNEKFQICFYFCENIYVWKREDRGIVEHWNPFFTNILWEFHVLAFSNEKLRALWLWNMECARMWVAEGNSFPY